MILNNGVTIISPDVHLRASEPSCSIRAKSRARDPTNPDCPEFPPPYKAACGIIRPCGTINTAVPRTWHSNRSNNNVEKTQTTLWSQAFVCVKKNCCKSNVLRLARSTPRMQPNHLCRKFPVVTCICSRLCACRWVGGWVSFVKFQN